jgi:hypothetical protein
VAAKVEAGVVVTFGGFQHPDGSDDPNKAKPYIDAGFTALTEAYFLAPNQDPNTTPHNLNGRAKWLGWPGTIPVIGTWGGVKPSDYVNSMTDFPFWAVWLAEGIYGWDVNG